MSERRASRSVVYRLLEILLAAQISLGSQDRNMAEKELNLFQFPAIDVAEFCARSPEIPRFSSFLRKVTTRF
jgi:hypothetical protein